MTEHTLASLAMDFNVATADPAIQKTNSLKESARELEAQARKTEAAVKSSAGAHSASGTAAGQAEASIKSLAQVYGQARDALGRFAKLDGDYRLSQEATILVALQNAKAQAALAKEQEQAAKLVAKAEADAARSREADMNATATLLIRNAKLQDDLRLKGEQAAKAVAKAEADAARSREADMNATAALLVRNAQLQANLAKEEEREASQVAALAKRYDALRADLDPLVAAQMTLVQRTNLLNEALAKGAITADQHAAAQSQVVSSWSASVLQADRLSKAHVGVTGTGKTLQYTLLNLGRQGADLGVGFAAAAASSDPLKLIFMTFIQQGPQIADAFATASAEGLGFKAVISGLVTETKALLLTFGPWIAGLAAIGGAVWLAVRATEEHEKRIKALYKSIDEQNKKLSESAPWLIQNADNAYLAAEGQKNFEKYLAKTNVTLTEHIRLMRLGAIEGLKNDLKTAQDNQKQAQAEFDRISSANGRGSSSMGFGTNVGGFSTISEAPTKAAIQQTDKYKEALKEVNKAADSARIAQDKLNAALKITPDDYGIFAGQASQAERLAGALDQLLPKEKQIRDIRQQRAIVEQALAKGQITAAQAERAMAEADRQIAEVNKDPAALKAAREAERKARAADKKELAEITKAYEEPIKASEKYADGLAKEVSTMGLSTEQQKRLEIAMAAAAAPTKALADQITLLGIQWDYQTGVMKAYEDQQKQVRAAANDNIVTFDQATKGQVEFSSVLEKVAHDLDDAAAMSRNLGYDVQDVADAINRNDWTSAFASLARVLLQVEQAFKNAKNAQDRFNAASMAAQVVGSAVGGTAGAAISGAASGASTGFMVAGPVGAVVGGIIGGLGGIFGSSSAKKKARQQAAAQAAAAEAQRQDQIADTSYNINLALLQAQGKATEALALQREHELAALTKLDPSLVDLQKQLYAAQDAADAAAKATEQAAAVLARQTEIQDQIDKLTLSDSELLAKTRAKERAEAVALDPALGDLIDKLYGLQDAASASSAAAEVAQAAADASQKAAEGYLSYLAKVSDDASKAQEQQASALQTVNAALSQTITNLNDLTKSLNAFADSLGFGDLAANDLGTQYDLAKHALASAKGDQIPAAAQAFLAIAKEHASTGLAYSQDVAFAQSVARGGAQAAQDDIASLKAFAPLYQALMSGNQAEFDKLVRGDLPGFANGGVLTIGGNSGVDNNLLSINGQPQAWVSSGEGLGIFPRRRGGANDNDMAAVVTELKALRQQVADLQATNQRAADNTGDTSDYLRNGVVATTGA